MTLQKWVIFIMGVYGEILCLLSDQAQKIVFGYLKNVDTHHESFSSKKKQVIKVIAKKPLTNLYEMNSTLQRPDI